MEIPHLDTKFEKTRRFLDQFFTVTFIFKKTRQLPKNIVTT